MKTNILIIIMIILWLPLNIYSQSEPEFKVLSKSGDVFLKVSKSKNWVKLKTGDQIMKDDMIKLNQGAYIGLVHKSGKTFELSTKGTYNLKQIASKIKGYESSITQRLSKYVIKQISESTTIFEESSKKTNNNSVGGVDRNPLGETQTNIIPKLCLPGNIVIIDKKIRINWFKQGSDMNYVFYINDRFDSNKFKKETNDTSINIDIDALNLERNILYYCYVERRNLKSSESSFIIPAESEIKSILDTAKMLIDEAENPNSAISKLSLAVYYEQKSIFNRALEYYKEAVKQSSNAQEFKNLYLAFLKRNGILVN